MLIVDDDVKVLRSRAKVLKAEGWSVASYTFRKLCALARKGALFVQHLKLEAQVVQDRDLRLSRILHSFTPKSDYTSELIENSRLAQLAACVPAGSRGPLLAADILYVTTRNFGVLRLAERGIHTYSFNAILDALEGEGLICRSSAQALAALRFLKCLYRNGEEVRRLRTLDVLNSALFAMPEKHFPKLVRLVDPVVILRRTIPQSSSPYFLLRDLELRLLAVEQVSHPLSLTTDLLQLRKWIENPRAYAFCAVGLAPKMRVAIDRQYARFKKLARSGGHANVVRSS